MPLPSGSYADVEATHGGFDPIDKGVYYAEISDIEERETKPENPKRQKWEAEHPGEVHPGYLSVEYTLIDAGPWTKRKVWQSIGLVESARGQQKTFLLATGHTEEELANPEFKFDPDRVLGTRVKVKIGKRAKRDSDGNVVKGEFNNPVEDVMMTDDEGDLLP